MKDMLLGASQGNFSAAIMIVAMHYVDSDMDFVTLSAIFVLSALFLWAVAVYYGAKEK